MTSENLKRLGKFLKEISEEGDSLFLAIATDKGSWTMVKGDDKNLVRCLFQYIESDEDDKRGKRVIVSAAMSAMANDDELRGFCINSLEQVSNDIKRLKEGKDPLFFKQEEFNSSLN